MTKLAKLIDNLEKVQDLKSKRVEADAFMKRAGKHLPVLLQEFYAHIVLNQVKSKVMIDVLEFEIKYRIALERANVRLSQVADRFGITVGGVYYLNRVTTKDGKEHLIEHVPMPAHMLAK